MEWVGLRFYLQAAVGSHPASVPPAAMMQWLLTNSQLKAVTCSMNAY